MPNDWFQFKQFLVHQERCGMKVTTDGCIQGAIAAAFCKDFFSDKEKAEVLDIGCGTGLLSLMIVQENKDTNLVAIDLDKGACQQATENFNQSPFAGRMSLHCCSVQEFQPPSSFSFIVSNPPFFHRGQHNMQEAKTLARHTVELTPGILARYASQWLSKDGVICVMYPPESWQLWIEAATKELLFPVKTVAVFPMQDAKLKRMIGFFSKEEGGSACQQEKLVIYKQDDLYTEAFIRLLRPFYIHL